jgi:hypothetical protein
MEGTESESEHQEVPTEEAAVETFEVLKKRYGQPASSRMEPPTAEETDPEQ